MIDEVEGSERVRIDWRVGRHLYFRCPVFQSLYFSLFFLRCVEALAFSPFLFVSMVSHSIYLALVIYLDRKSVV